MGENMQFIDFKRIIDQYLPEIFKDSKDVNEIFVRENADWIILWFKELVRITYHYAKLRGKEDGNDIIKLPTALFATFARMEDNDAGKMLKSHIEDIFYGLVFSKGKMKGFYELKNRLPTKKDRVIICYYNDVFFNARKSKIDGSVILETEIAVVPDLTKEENETNNNTNASDPRIRNTKKKSRPKHK